MEVLFDRKSDCYSVVLTLKLRQYFSLAEKVYDNNGGLDGQRSAVTTKSAKRIRSRMVDDFIEGAVLPPVVIGVTSEAVYKKVDSNEVDDLEDIVLSTDGDEVAIIDGMQRTTAMYEALKKLMDEEKEDLLDKNIRIELWISKDTSSLIYRMLVLNTGQVPWNLRRQLEVILRPLTKEIESKVNGIELIAVDDSQYRKRAGSFQADRVLELYLIFASRKEKIDAKEQVADEYARLDVIEASSHESLIGMFCSLLQRIVALDTQLWKMESLDEGRFKEGKDLLNSQPMLSSLVSVIAQFVLGRPGGSHDEEKVKQKLEQVYSGFDSFLDKVSSLSSHDKKEFFAFDTLNEIIKLKGSGGKVGDAERDFFRSAFKVLLEDKFDVNTMEVCWRV